MAGEQHAGAAATEGTWEAGTGTVKRIDIISDTHGHISPELRRELAGADLIVHAGDITSEEDYAELCSIAPVKACLGNNDYFYNYGPEVPMLNRFEYAGLSFAVCHYRQELPFGEVDVAVCGHTHRAKVEHSRGTVVVNPGSASFPRGTTIPTIARMTVRDGEILSLELVPLKRS